MQTERASSLASQRTEMEEKLRRAVEQLEARYRGLLIDALNKGDIKQPSSLNVISTILSITFPAFLQ